MDPKKLKSHDRYPLFADSAQMSIVLIGHPRCGKSYFAERFASSWKIPWVDTDRLLEEEYSIETGQRASCSEIFQKIGKIAFREREGGVIERISPSIPVIATGGGAVLEKKNVALLQKKGLLVFLVLPEEVWKERISFWGFPQSFSSQYSLEALYRERNQIYETVADVKISLEKKNEEHILREISQIVGWL